MYVKKVHPVYSAEIWTHDIWNMSLLHSVTRLGNLLDFWQMLKDLGNN